MSAGWSCHSEKEPLTINSDYISVDSQPSGCVGSSMPKASLHVIPCTPLTRLPVSQPTEKKIYTQVRWCEGIVLDLYRLDKVDVNKSQTCTLDSWVLPWSLCRWLKSLWIGRRPYRSTVAFLPPYTTVLTPSSFAIVTWMYPSRKVARAKKNDIRTLNNAHELAHLPLLMMTTFLGSNNASFGVGEVKYSGWHSSPSLQGH